MYTMHGGGGALYSLSEWEACVLISLEWLAEILCFTDQLKPFDHASAGTHQRAELGRACQRVGCG